MQLTLRILRYTQGDAQPPRYQNFTLDMPPSATVLDCLEEIKGHQDGSLTFRRSCRSAICGSCAIRINGRSGLACKTQARDVMDSRGRLTLEPLRYQPVIKDLVVDQSPYWQRYHAIIPWVTPQADLPEKENRISPREVERMGTAETCINCGACLSSCPIVLTDPDYLGPAALAAAWRFCNDSRDTRRAERLKVVDSANGVWRCHTVFNCIDACPKGLNPTWAITQLRNLIMREKLFGGRS